MVANSLWNYAFGQICFLTPYDNLQMKKRLFVFLALIFSCADNNQKLLPGSSGNINNISVVINDELWDGEVGE